MVNLCVKLFSLVCQISVPLFVNAYLFSPSKCSNWQATLLKQLTQWSRFIDWMLGFVFIFTGYSSNPVTTHLLGLILNKKLMNLIK